MTAALIKLVHVGCRELGIDGETRRDLQLLVTGKESMAGMTAADLEKMVAALKARGFAPTAKGKGRRAAAQHGGVRFAHVLWGKLVRAGVVDQAGRAGLNAFVRARFEKAWGAVPIDVDAMADWKQISALLEALKAMCRRAGIEAGK